MIPICVVGLTLLLASCSDNDPSLKGEYICRKSSECFFPIEEVSHRKREQYPWELSYVGEHPRITKEFFRCKGTHCNPVRIIEQGEETIRLSDCGGCEAHSLPIRNNKPYISPILIDLLNYVQEATGMRVVITCGHRCPVHNRYSDPRPFNRTSKHMIGAEVDFYVQGLEEEPERVVALLEAYYMENRALEFERYHKENTDVATPPWYNREIFVKLYLPDEGRDGDNRHPYPYIGIQVRRDYETDEPVVYSWERATSYHR